MSQYDGSYSCIYLIIFILTIYFILMATVFLNNTIYVRSCQVLLLVFKVRNKKSSSFSTLRDAIIFTVTVEHNARL